MAIQKKSKEMQVGDFVFKRLSPANVQLPCTEME